MYIPKRPALKIKCNFSTYQNQAEQIALIDSGATDNFIDYRTTVQLRPGTQRLPQPRKVINVDGTENRGGQITHCVHLYIQYRNKQKRAKFFITNLEKAQLILGYPWLEEFNPEINWTDGKLLGTSVHLKTPALVVKEQLKTRVRETETKEISKVTIAQQMAERHFKDSDTVKTATIPPKYQIHTKVFSEKEAKRFPSSREWDHRIPLKKDAPDTINAKLFSLPQKN